MTFDGSMVFSPVEESFFNSLIHSFRQKVLRQQDEPAPSITIQQASNICNSSQSALTRESDVRDIAALGFADFVDYLKSIRSEYLEYRRLQLQGEVEAVEPENLEEMVVSCYQDVPQLYFESPFRFNFGLLALSREQINQFLDETTHQLDQVEVTLFYQINSRFDQFLSVILNLNHMNGLIEQNIYKVQSLRKLYSSARQVLVRKSQEIITKKQAVEKAENVLYNLKLVQSVSKSLAGLTELINTQKYEQAIKLLKATESTYQKLKQIQCLKNIQQRLNALHNHLMSSMTSHLLTMLLSQLTQQIVPTKVLLNQLGQIGTEQEDSMLSNSFVNNDSYFDQSKFDGVRPIDEQFGRLVACAQNAIDLSDKVYRMKLIEELQGYYQEFVTQVLQTLQKDAEDQILRQFDESSMMERLTEVMEELPHQVFIKIVCFFAENLKKVLINQIAVGQQLAAVIVENAKAVEIVEEHYSIIVAFLKFSNEKIAMLLQCKRITAEYQVKEFVQLIEVYKSWETFFHTEVAKMNEEVVNGEKLTPKIKSQFQKCSINHMIFLRASQEKQYLQLFHKEKMIQIMKYLENETWGPSDISFDNYEVISYLLDLDENTAQELDESVILNTSVVGGKNLLQQLVNNNVFKLLKTEIIMLKENQKYKATQAFLFFIQTIYNYIRLFEHFASLTNEQTSKVVELIKSYNSLATQFILGAGAVHFGKITTITAKNLAISSICLRLFIYLIEPISVKLIRVLNSFQQNDFTNAVQLSGDLNKIKSDYVNHNAEIVSKLATILIERIDKQIEEIAKLEWNDVQQKIPIPSKSTNQIIQNTRSLYIAVEDILLQDDLKVVFQQVLVKLQREYINCFRSLNISTKIGFQRIKEEMEYFLQSFKEIGLLPTLLAENYSSLEEEINKAIEKLTIQ